MGVEIALVVTEGRVKRMEKEGGVKMKMKEYLPHLLMILSFLGLAVFIVCVQSLFSSSGSSVSGPVFVFYQHIVSTFLLSILSFIFERKRRPPLTFQIVGWAFLLGFLQITLFQLLLTSSLRFITATFQSVALNTSMPLLFILAVIFRQETFHLCSVNGQAKLWGIIISAGGATIMLLWSGPDLRGTPPLNGLPGIGKRVIGSVMIAGALFASDAWNLLVGGVATKYPAEISLSAMMCLSGTVLTGVVAAITERSVSAWKITADGLELPSILYGGIVTTGLAYYVQTWCVHKKGPVFASAFSPLLIVFSFLLETFIFKKATHLGSIIGTVLVVVGLYLILWAKAEDEKKKVGEEKSTLNDPFIDPYDRLSFN